MGNVAYLTDAQMSWSQGVDSVKVTTIASPSFPEGLGRTELAWLINAGVRDGGITQRSGWSLLLTVDKGSGIYQGGFMYDPDNSDPYLMLSIGGRILAVVLSGTLGVSDISAKTGITNPPTPTQTWWTQGEEFLVIQAGDYGLVTTPTLPLFWDGNNLRRSLGLNPGPNTPKELPAATAMVYYQGRIWYAQSRQYIAGDIVKGPSGTGNYNFRDAILKVTENPLAIGGDGFAVPSSAGNIRALQYTANLDDALGQGPLYIFTRKQIYQLQVPVTRTDWIAAGNNNQPVQTIAQRTNGSVNDRGIVAINGDLFYQSLEPAIRSLISAVRYYQQWANTPISSNIERLVQFNNRALLRYASGVEFNNRLIQTALPRATSRGVVHDALAVLDFQPVSSFKKPAVPVWEGSWEGLPIMQMFTGDFGGHQRCFAVVLSSVDNSIQIWEFTDANQFDINATGESRVTWQIEFPAYTCNKPEEKKVLDTWKLWFDRIFGIVDFKVEFRPDGDPCWHFWHQFRLCQARDTGDFGQVSYPVREFCEGDAVPVAMPKAPGTECSTSKGRPVNWGYQFQVRLTIKGFCRVRRGRVYCQPKEENAFEGLICSPQK